ncbi:hypothetical protein BvCmsH13A_03523 [Escherichia coli]|nr:hypothetical protein BvCmsH13A_03523 [Escherichia coli]
MMEELKLYLWNRVSSHWFHLIFLVTLEAHLANTYILIMQLQILMVR